MTSDWHHIREHVEVKPVCQDDVTYVLARSKKRRAKERAMRKRRLLGLHGDLKKLADRVSKGRLRSADKALEGIGRLRERWPGASKFVEIGLERDESGQARRVSWSYRREALRTAMQRDGAYLLMSDRIDWDADKLWTTYIQLTRAEAAFRALKSDLLLRPIWHELANRTAAHVFVCVLAYALWKSLDHLLKNARVMTRIRKKDPVRGRSGPQDRPMSPAEALRILHGIQIGDILLETTDHRTLCLRRVARPTPEQAELLAALKLELPERLRADSEWITAPASPSPSPAAV